MDSIKIKKVIAKEILVFFAGLLLLGFVWLFLVLRNQYYIKKVESCKEQIKSKQTILDTLPTNYIKNFYDLINNEFILNYSLDLGSGKSISCCIPKESEKSFISENHGRLKLLPIHNEGYSYWDFSRSRPEKTVFNDPPRELIIKFDYVPYDIFKKFIVSRDYQDELFSEYGGNSSSSLKFEKFSELINRSLIYNDLVKENRKNIEGVVRKQQELYSDSIDSIFISEQIQELLIKALIIIGLLLYCVRYSIQLLLWAFKTVKQIP